MGIANAEKDCIFHHLQLHLGASDIRQLWKNCRVAQLDYTRQSSNLLCQPIIVMQLQDAAPIAHPARYVPRLVLFTKGQGVRKDYLTSFELALRDAEIADPNLVSG